MLLTLIILNIIILLIYKIYNKKENIYKYCQKPTKDNPYMNIIYIIKKKLSCSIDKSKHLIDKYTNFKIFDLFYNENNNLNYFNNQFYTKPITTYIHNFFPLINWSYKTNTDTYKLNKINTKAHNIIDDNINTNNNKINIINNINNNNNYINYNNYINKLNNSIK